MRLAAYALCVLAWAVLWWPWLTGHFTIPYDAKAHFHAQLQFLAHALHSGQSPFWNPNEFAGQPQVADPQSLIFSPAILIALFDASPGIGAIDGYAFALLAAASLAILSFALDKGWHPAGAVVAAIAFSFGASAAWRIQHIGQIQSYALFGVTLWALARALDRRSVLWGVATGCAAGVMVVEPDQIALLACYLLAGYVIAEITRRERPLAAARELVPTLATMTLVGLVIAIVPVVLTYLFVEGSNRPQIAMAEAARGSLNPASLLTGLVGDLFGALDPKVEYWGPYSASWSPENLTLSQNMSQIYTGALSAMLLLGAGLVRREVWREDIRYFGVALVAMTIYALGVYTPLFAPIYSLPGVALFRRPADATFLMGGMLAIIGGYLVHRIARGDMPVARGRRRQAEIAIVGSVFAIAFGIALVQGHAMDAAKPIGLAMAWTGAAYVLVEVLPRLAAARPAAALATVGLFMVADLTLNNGPNESTALPASRYEFLDPRIANPTIGFIKKVLQQPPGSPRRDRVELAGLGFEWPNIGMIYGFDHDLGYNPLRLSLCTRVFGAGENIAGWDQRQFTPLFPSYRSLMADMLGLRFIAVPVPVQQVDKTLQAGDLVLVQRTKDAYIYENPRALPRAMFVGNWQIADFENMIETGHWPSFDARETLLLEAPPPEPVAQTVPEAGHARAMVALPVYTNTHVEVEVLALTPGFVLLNSVWHPWWQVTVDGKPAELLRANVLFRAVQVGAGRHRVSFNFEPFNGALSQIAGYWRSSGQTHRRRALNPPT